MRILTKVKLSEECMKERLSHELYDWELYTDRKSLMSKKNIDYLLYGVTNELFTIHSIHVPESNKQGALAREFCIDYYTMTNCDQKEFVNVCILANELAKIQKQTVTVVLHASYEIPIDPNNTGFLTSVSYMYSILDSFKNIKIVIENISATEDIEHGYWSEPVYYVHYFRKKFKSSDVCDRLGVLLDTCHAWASQHRLVTKYNDTLLKDYYNEKYSMFTFINLYASYLEQLHLSNCIEEGILKEQHGAKFESFRASDRNRLINVIQTLQDVNFKGNIVLEIAEDEYPSSANVLKTLQTLQDLNVLKREET